MVSVMSLWLPILLSAVFVFIVSSIIHMVLKYHNSDFKEVPKEADVMDALRPFNLEPGMYSMPRPKDMKDMGSPEFQEKMKKGPVAMLTVIPNGPTKMGSALVKWFALLIVISLFAAYVAGITLPPGTEYITVFRITSVVAFVAYTTGIWSQNIWYGLSTGTTIKSTIDGLIYGLVTGGTFGWLWPAM